jgi:alpha-L-rhamnosidase
VTETCQYYAFFHGIATPKSHPELWKKLTDEFGPERQAKGLYKDVWPSNAFIGNLLRLIVLKREGHDDQVAREIRGYYLKMAKSTGTLWEHDRPEASCNHAFASALAILLQADFDTYFATKD